jgi:hypothetical protein
MTGTAEAGSTRVPGFGCSRYEPARILPGATEFSADPALRDPVQVVRELKCHPQFLAPIREAAVPEHTVGAKRKPGDWLLIYIAYLLTPGVVDMDSFWDANQSSAMWKEAGFGDWLPCAETLRLRFAELEHALDGFEKANALLIRHARRHEPQIGRITHTDSHAIQTHSSLQHWCTDKEQCKRLIASGRRPNVPLRAEDTLISDERAGDSQVPEEDLDKLPPNALRPLDPNEVHRLGLDEITWGHERQYRWYRQNGHLYRLRDGEAGCRRYGGPGQKTKFWPGFYGMPVTDALVGAPLVIEVEAADRHEHHLYENAARRAIEATGIAPHAAVFDRGFGTKAVYRFNTTRGIGTVMPWREPRAGIRRHHLECEDFDRHGKLRCRHCGGPMEDRGQGLGFYITDGGQPRIRARCILQLDSKCARPASVACSQEWRMLQPLNLTDPLYEQLRHRHGSTERIHLHLRGRYREGGKETIVRFKRTGIGAVKLRAAAIVFIEWFRVLLRHGWLGSWRKINKARPSLRPGGARLLKVMLSRKKCGVDLPYGPAGERFTGPGGPAPPGEGDPAY